VVVVDLDSCANIPQGLSYDFSAEGTVNKKTIGSGGVEPELAADGLFDIFRWAAIVLR
jgi:hypothetical protein